MKTNYLFWQNYDLDIKDYDWDDEMFDDYSDDDKWDYVVEDNWNWLDELRHTFNHELDEEIISIADLGLWYGRRMAYRELGKNLKNILNVLHDYGEIF